MNKRYLVYIHTNKINGKVYIGQTCQKPEYRWGSHGQGYVECPHFWRAIQKYGWINFDHTIQADGLTHDEACAQEIELIAQLKATDPQYGYNLSHGGDGPDPEITRALWKDDSFRSRAREKMQEAWKDPTKRMRRSEAARQRWADSSFRTYAMQRVIKSCAKSVECIETGKIYDTVRDAAIAYKASPGNIVRSCKTHFRCAGFHWKYVDDTP